MVNLVDIKDIVWLEKKSIGKNKNKDSTELKIAISYTRKKQVKGVLLSFSNDVDKQYFTNFHSIKIGFMPKRLYLKPTNSDGINCYKLQRTRENARPTILVSQLKGFEQYLGSHTLSVGKEPNGDFVYFIDSIK